MFTRRTFFTACGLLGLVSIAGAEIPRPIIMKVGTGVEWFGDFADYLRSANKGRIIFQLKDGSLVRGPKIVKREVKDNVVYFQTDTIEFAGKTTIKFFLVDRHNNVLYEEETDDVKWDDGVPHFYGFNITLPEKTVACRKVQQTPTPLE